MFSDIGTNVLMMDYRGYGMSSGTPSEKGIIMDAESVLDFAKTHPLLVDSPIILFGRSLGGAVSLSLYERRPSDVNSIILENAFLSVSDMVDVYFPFMRYAQAVKKKLLVMEWNNTKKIQEVTVPILFVAGKQGIKLILRINISIFLFIYL
jgi:pimeloyl-ACP methyl ester carboxylesterase